MVYMCYLGNSIFDIFMVMYFGDEITSESGELSYCLFESNWIDQPQLSKKIMLIFAERLKKPQMLIILELYPLTCETFIRVCSRYVTQLLVIKM